MVQETVPILAVRAAKLLPEKFASVAQIHTFGRQEDAVCLAGGIGVIRSAANPHWAGHERYAPDPDCSCGFYAVPADGRPYHQSLWETSVELQVELRGRIIEHELGYRAQRQIVLEVRVPRMCQTSGIACSCYGLRESRSIRFATSTLRPAFGSARVSCRKPGRRKIRNLGETLNVTYVSFGEYAKRVGVPVIQVDAR